MKAIGRTTILAALLAASVTVAADEIETIEMEGMAVIGNRESPKLLYIVPWKPSKMPEMKDPVLLADPFGSALEPVERNEMIRDVRYRNARERTNELPAQQN